MNKRHDDPLDRSIRSALGDIIADGPTPSRLPVSPYEQRRTPAPVRSRRPMLVAAAVVAVAGVAGTVAIANRSSGPTTVAPADSVADSTPIQEGVGPITTIGSDNAPLVGTDVTPTTSVILDRKEIDLLLYPAHADGKVSISTTVLPSARRLAMISPAGHLFGLSLWTGDLLPRDTGEWRTIGSREIRFGREDNVNVYGIDGVGCGFLTIETDRANEANSPWGEEVLSIIHALSLDNAAGTVRIGRPDSSWTAIDTAARAEGTNLTRYDIVFEASANGGPAQKYRLYQMLGRDRLGTLMDRAGQWVSAAPVNGGQQNVGGYFLQSGVPGTYGLAWVTEAGAAVLVMEGEADSSAAQSSLQAVSSGLETGHFGDWNAVTGNLSVPSDTQPPATAAVATTVQVGVDVTTSYPADATPTTTNVCGDWELVVKP